MIEKIAWFEELLTLEPNSKLFFPLAKAYVQDHRFEDAVVVLRKGLSMHPEHMEARLLLVQCLASQDQDVAAQSEVKSLVQFFLNYPAFWSVWASQSRNSGQDDLALTLEMLSRLVSGNAVGWGAVFEKGLRALSSEEKFPAPAFEPEVHAHPQAIVNPSSGSKTSVTLDSQDTPLERPSSDFAQPGEIEATVTDDHRLPDESQGDRTGQEQIDDALNLDKRSADDVAAIRDGKGEKEVDFASPVAHQKQMVLSEGERKYYETKTYAELLAKQGENAEALELYTKLLQSSPDDVQRQEMQTRIAELRDHINKNPVHFDSSRIVDQSIAPEEVHGPTQSIGEAEVSVETEAPPRTTTSSETVRTLTRLAERLESRARI